jgi:hypothetical protein
MYYLSNVIFTQNDAKILNEHIALHRSLGVEYFIVYDETTYPPYPRDVLKGQNDVLIIDTKLDDAHNAHRHYEEAAKYLTGKSYWVIYNDTDEMLIPVKTNDLRDMMEYYEDCAQVGFCWLTFGSNFLEKEPECSVFEAFTKRSDFSARINGGYKVVVKPEEVVSTINSHSFVIKTNPQKVNENKEIITNDCIISPGIHNIGFTAHYRARSREYFEKVRRPRMQRILRADDNKPLLNFRGSYPESWSVEDNDIEDLRVRNLYLRLVKGEKL